MQATYARETFPCFDEPGLKATFDISLRHKPTDYALSNMDEKNMVKMQLTLCSFWLDECWLSMIIM